MSKIEKMADINATTDENILPSDVDTDEFEQMLSDFISNELEDNLAEAQQAVDEIEERHQTQESASSELSYADEEEEEPLKLNEHEFSLLRAYRNFMYAIETLCEEGGYEAPVRHVSEENLYPHYKKKAGANVSRDILNGWDILMQLFPTEMQNIQPDSSDDQLLDAAERCEDENLQLGLISYVETLIELEGCEIDYEARKIRFERKQLEKEIYEEHQRRIERAQCYIRAIQEKNFPVDAERLVNNYFRLSGKDPKGSFKALTTNPATFAPIDFGKMRDRFFGIIKVKPQDGIRINQKLGNFLRRLKA